MRDAYHRPPEAPRDEMWVAIEAELAGGREATEATNVTPIAPAGRGQTLRKRVWNRPWAPLAAAAAALLVMGIGLGRLSVSPSGTPTEPEDVASADVASADLASAEVASAEVASRTMRVAAVEHFSRTESLLTMVSSDARAGRVDAEVGEWARALLLHTRLLMNSSALRDPVILDLIEDLEVILMQVVRLSPQADVPQRGELDLMTEGLEDNDIMLRIRAILPSGSVQAAI